MTTPEQKEPQQLNEPEHLEAEGYLNRALRRLGKVLGRFVFEKIRDKELLADEERSIVTRDLRLGYLWQNGAAAELEQAWFRP